VEFYADRNLGRYDFPEYLRAHGLTVHAHDDHFAQDAEDEVWIPQVAGRGWIILAADKDVLHVPIELAAVMLSGARFLNLVGGHVRAVELARNVVNTVPKIEAFVNEHPAPFVAKVYRPSPPERALRGTPGSIELKMSHGQWLRSRRSLGFRPED
jgi:hypothetical protein